MVRQAHHERRSEDFEKALLETGTYHTPFTIITFDSVALILNSFGPA